MDLGAYAQIEDLDVIAKANNIDCPRLRGYRLMSEEESIDLKEAIDKNEIARDCVKELCESKPFWSTHPGCWEWSDQTDYIKTYYRPYKKQLISSIHRL